MLLAGFVNAAPGGRCRVPWPVIVWASSVVSQIPSSCGDFGGSKERCEVFCAEVGIEEELQREPWDPYSALSHRLPRLPEEWAYEKEVGGGLEAPLCAVTVR